MPPVTAFIPFRLQEALDEVEWIVQDAPVNILKATLGEYAGAYGAASLAMKD